MRAKKIVIQSSDFPVRRTGSYRHKKKHCINLSTKSSGSCALTILFISLHVCRLLF